MLIVLIKMVKQDKEIIKKMYVLFVQYYEIVVNGLIYFCVLFQLMIQRK